MKNIQFSNKLINLSFNKNKKMYKNVNSSDIALKMFIQDLSTQADLNDSVLPILKPALERINDLITGEHENLLSFEEKRQMENIIIRDFPKLLEDYKSVPINIRNELFLENGKTYRQNLIESFANLISIVKDLEISAIKEIEKKIRIKNNAIEEIYGKNEKEKITFPEFNWLKKKEIKNDNMNYLNNDSVVNNKPKVLLKKRKLRHIKRKFKNVLSKTGKSCEEIMMDPLFFSQMVFLIPIIFIAIIGITTIIKAHHNLTNQILLSMKLDNDSKIEKTMYWIYNNEINKNPLTQNKLHTLEKTTPNMSWSKNEDNKTVHIVLSDVSPNECKDLLKPVRSVDEKINNLYLTQNVDSIDESSCGLEHNKMEFNFLIEQ